MARPENGLASGGRRFHLGCPLAAAIIVLILALLSGIIFFRTQSWLERVAREGRDAFVSLAHLQPRVTIEDRTYLEQTTTVTELAVIARQIEVDHQMVHSWAGSQKRIKLHGTFLVKAGFDLRHQVAVNISPAEVVVLMPHAQILSVEQKQVDVLAFENGFWNRISPNDIENELAALPQLAQRKSAALPREAEQTFSRQLLKKFHPKQPVRAIFLAPQPVK